jgi:DNA-binding transcriptional MerR regulator
MTAPSRNYRLMPLIAFGIDEVAELTGLSVRQLQRWDRNGFFEPTYADPNRRRPASRIYSRDDVVALRIIARLRELRVPFAELRSLLPKLPHGKNGKEAPRQLFVFGDSVYFTEAEAVVAASVAQGRCEPTTIDIETLIAALTEAIERLRERKPEEIDKVVRRRGTMGGVPIIAGTRIPTEFIAWYHDSGYSMDWILREFPRLTPADVRAAVAFESQREAKSPDPVLVRG